MSTAIILFAHGARDPGWAAPVHELAARLKKAGVRAEPAFLEHMQPGLESAVDALASAGVNDILMVLAGTPAWATDDHAAGGTAGVLPGAAGSGT